MASTKSTKRIPSVRSLVRREHLNDAFVGFSAAIEWLACRGKSVPGSNYSKLIDEAARALVDALSSLLENQAKGVVEGINLRNPAAGHRSIPHGLWPSVGVTVLEFGEKTYELALVDNDSEWGGEITSVGGFGYTQLRIQSAFILELSESLKLPSHPKNFIEVRRSLRFSSMAVESFLDLFTAKVPESLRPLTRAELEQCAKLKFPDAPRDKLREIARKLAPNSKRGPSGPRNPDRKQQLAEFRRKVISA